MSGLVPVGLTRWKIDPYISSANKEDIIDVLGSKKLS
jgi:hypothetical protein